jgi:hypothetical protein
VTELVANVGLEIENFRNEKVRESLVNDGRDDKFLVRMDGKLLTCFDDVDDVDDVNDRVGCTTVSCTCR